MLCYNGRFEDYKGLYEIATDSFKKKKKEITRTNFWIKVNSLLSVLYSLSFIHIFCPISADLDDLPSPEFPLLKKRTRQNTGGRLAQLLGATNKTCKICQLPQFPHTIKEKKWAFPLSTFLDQMQPNCVLFEMPRASPNFACSTDKPPWTLPMFR